LNLVQQHVGNEVLNVKKTYLLECSKHVRALVLQFIDTTKSHMNNPYDILTKQKLDGKRYIFFIFKLSILIFSLDVVASVRALIDASQALIADDQENKNLTRDVNIVHFGLVQITNGIKLDFIF
jgi:hypothetical protein